MNIIQTMTKASKNPRSWIKPVHLILDFDGTITRSDTLATLASIGYTHQKSYNNDNNNNISQPKPTPWPAIVNAYLRDFETHASSYRPEKSSRTTFALERAWLRSLKPIEEASADRALKGRVWDGVSRSEVMKGAADAVGKGEFRCRDGWEELVEWVKTWNGGFGMNGQRGADVLSVNWSRTFVWACLVASSHGSLEGDSLEDFSHARLNLGVYANELPSVAGGSNKHFKDENRPSGEDCILRTSEDKLNQILLLLKDTRQKSGDAMDEKENMTVYIGDSTTDLECLVEADIGICIRDDPMGSSQRDLAETCNRVGIAVRHLSELHEDNVHDLFWAKDFLEVKSCLHQAASKFENK